jgi:hypothetical protein
VADLEKSMQDRLADVLETRGSHPRPTGRSATRSSPSCDAARRRASTPSSSTPLSHIPGSEDALAEARRVRCPGGWVTAFDGDYATTTVALGADDPLQTCMRAMVANSVDDRWVVRRGPALARACGL